MKFEIEYYEYEDKKSKKIKIPMNEILEDLKSNPKLEAKFFREFDLLEEHGFLKEPHVKPLEDGLFELRIIQGNNHARTFFFYIKGRKIIMTHVCIKKTNKTPRKEINKALEYKEEYEGRKK